MSTWRKKSVQAATGDPETTAVPEKTVASATPDRRRTATGGGR
jgi:hypothetical protein